MFLKRVKSLLIYPLIFSLLQIHPLYAATYTTSETYEFDEHGDNFIKLITGTFRNALAARGYGNGAARKGLNGSNRVTFAFMGADEDTNPLANSDNLDTANNDLDARGDIHLHVSQGVFNINDPGVNNQFFHWPPFLLNPFIISATAPTSFSASDGPPVGAFFPFLFPEPRIGSVHIEKKYNDDNEWVIIVSCTILRDKSWGRALDTGHGILGFADHGFGFFTPKNADLADALEQLNDNPSQAQEAPLITQGIYSFMNTFFDNAIPLRETPPPPPTLENLQLTATSINSLPPNVRDTMLNKLLGNEVSIPTQPPESSECRAETVVDSYVLASHDPDAFVYSMKFVALADTEEQLRNDFLPRSDCPMAPRENPDDNEFYRAIWCGSRGTQWNRNNDVATWSDASQIPADPLCADINAGNASPTSPDLNNPETGGN